jgi:hypothetical protein
MNPAKNVPAVAPAPGPWRLGPADLAIGAVSLTLVLGVCLPIAASLHREASALDRRREEVLERSRAARATLAHLERRREAHTLLRRVVDRTVADIESRPIVPWMAVVSELSSRRPPGLRAVRLSGAGPGFRVQVSSERGALVADYTRALRESAVVDLAADATPLPLAPNAPGRGQVVGRLMGE